MLRSLAIASVLLFSVAGSFAEEPPKNATKVAPTVFRVEVSLDGVFESTDMTEIIIRPEEWAEFTIRELVPHGTRVKQGDTLIEFDPRKLANAIHDLEAGLHAAELAIHQNNVEIAATEPLLPLDLDAAARARRDATADLDRFNKIERELTIRQAEQALKQTKQYLEMEEAELRELEKMYKADDLTEETEEIILKRQKDAVEHARFALEVAKINQEKALKIDLPRKEEGLKDAAQRQTILFEKARSAAPMALMKLKIDGEKLKVERARSQEKLEKLKQDMASMSVKAPRDGIVYYGACTLGNWPSSTELAVKLKRGAAALPNDVLLTIVDPGQLEIRSTVTEKQLGNLKRGTTGNASWGDDDSCRAPVRLESLSAVPIAPGKFAATLSLGGGGKSSVTPLPGMACSVQLLAYAKENALAVPSTAVQSEEGDSTKRYVNVVAADGKREKRAVTIGRKSDKQTEILEGLNPGEYVLNTKPEE